MEKTIRCATFLLLFISAFCHAQEKLSIPWPENERWKIGSDQDTDQLRMMELVSGNDAPKAVLTEIESDEKARNPCIMFKIEAPSFNNDPKPESQLYYILQGDQNLYFNFIALQKKELPKDFIEKWKAIFKNSKLNP